MSATPDFLFYAQLHFCKIHLVSMVYFEAYSCTIKNYNHLSIQFERKVNRTVIYFIILKLYWKHVLVLRIFILEDNAINYNHYPLFFCIIPKMPQNKHNQLNTVTLSSRNKR